MCNLVLKTASGATDLALIGSARLCNQQGTTVRRNDVACLLLIEVQRTLFRFDFILGTKHGDCEESPCPLQPWQRATSLEQ